MIDLITSNLVWILLGLFVLMHLRGHGCGGHGARGSNEATEKDDPRSTTPDAQSTGPN